MACAETAAPAPVPPPPPANDPDGRLIWAVTLSWPSDCRSWVDSLLRNARQWRPDLVVVEPVEHAGRIVAAALRLPLIVHGWGFTLPAHVETAAHAGILDVYDRFSATPQPPVLVADLGSAEAQAPDIGTVQRYRYQPLSVPGRPVPARQQGKRRVLITLGTYTNPDAAALLRSAAADAMQDGTEVIAVLGNDDRGSRESFPAGVTALKWVDMPAVMANCDLIVHHGGAGTSWTALSVGKPAVVLPQAGDQFRNAEILSAAEVALVRRPGHLKHLSSTIKEALNSAALAQRTADIAGDNAALPDVAELAHRIATLASGAA